jgi:hypothetical protein
MQMKFANRDELAWQKGELAYSAGDTIDTAVKKAMDAGFRPGSNGYAAFITAFSRCIRNGSPRQELGLQHAQGMNASAALIVPGCEQGINS